MSNRMIKWFIPLVCVMLIILSGLNNSNTTFSKLGYLAIGFIMTLGCIAYALSLIHKQYIFKKEKWIHIYSLLLILIYLFSILLNPQITGVYTAVQVSLLIVYFWGIVNFSINKINLQSSYYIVSSFLLIHFIWWIIENTKIPFSGIMNNPNPFGAFIAFLIGIFLMLSNNVKNNFFLTSLTLFFGLCLLYASGARASWLIVIAASATYFVWPIISKNKMVHSLYFIFILFLVISITVIYPQLLHSQLGSNLQTISRDFTGKNFFSGRQVIWNDLLNLIYQKPFLGYGASARPNEFGDTVLSAHNFYLQMTLQVGVIGSFIFLLLLFSIWSYTFTAKNDKNVKLTSSIFIGIILYQVFEVSFTQNILALSILQWLFIGIGVHLTRLHHINKKSNLIQGSI